MSDNSNDGMLPKLDEFWASWQSLSTDPTSNSLRAILLDNAGSLTNAFTRRSAQITQMRLDQDLVISDKVDQINSLASEVAGLNAEISRIASVGEQPNDLMDKRDLALDRLSELAGAVSFDQKNGETTVSIAGHVLVVGHETIKLKTVTRPVDLSDPTSLAVQDVYWDDNRQLVPPSGELKGVLQVRDEFLRNQQIGLNTLASNLITEVNALHASGYGLNNAHGLNFFTGTDANTIAVNSTLDPASIGASSGADQPGNIAIATQIAGLKFDKLMAGSITMNEFYNQQITERSLTIKDAVDNAYSQNVVVKSLGQQRESVAGVSLDEEAANMARTQKAYQAAARLLTAYDEMLDTVINRMGLVGR
jgi:flagellar hook-associated protein 1 FlgK